jgi:hypothetical protein
VVIIVLIKQGRVKEATEYPSRKLSDCGHYQMEITAIKTLCSKASPVCSTTKSAGIFKSNYFAFLHTLYLIDAWQNNIIVGVFALRQQLITCAET